jgi:hypothetical protein
MKSAEKKMKKFFLQTLQHKIITNKNTSHFSNAENEYNGSRHTKLQLQPHPRFQKLCFYVFLGRQAK